MVALYFMLTAGHGSDPNDTGFNPYNKVKARIDRDIVKKENLDSCNYSTILSYILETYKNDLDASQQRTLVETLDVESAETFVVLTKKEFKKSNYNSARLTQLETYGKFLQDRIRDAASNKKVTECNRLFKSYRDLRNFLAGNLTEQTAKVGGVYSKTGLEARMKNRSEWLKNTLYTEYFQHNAELKNKLVNTVPENCRLVHYRYLEAYYDAIIKEYNRQKTDREVRKKLYAWQRDLNRECNAYNDLLGTYYQSTEKADGIKNKLSRFINSLDNNQKGK